MRNKRLQSPLSTETLAVHAGRQDFAQLGVHAPPIDLSSTYPLGDLDASTASLDALAAGRAEAPNSVYARLHNPTVARFEESLAALEGAAEAVAFSSGMAALTAVLLALKETGDGSVGRKNHVVAVRPLYGGSDHLLSNDLLGIETTFTKANQVAAAIRPETSLVIVETPANPTLRLVDLGNIVAQAGCVPVLVDSTFATPILQKPLDQGVALVMHSATKFLGGHSDVMGGVVATSSDLAARLRQVRVLTGALLHPLSGYLLHRGLATLPARVDWAQRGAQALAERLAERLAANDGVTAVHYPGLPGGDPEGLIGRQMSGPGAILAFEVADYETAADLLANLRLITHAVSLGSTDTLIQHPAGLTHRIVSDEARAQGGISPGLLRVSVGLESPDDLWTDLSNALDLAVSRPRHTGLSVAAG